MGKKKREWTRTMRGAQLMAPGDVIRLMDQGSLLKCRVLSCLATEDGGCLANVVVMEGERKDEKIQAKLVPGKGSLEETEDENPG